MTGRAYAAVETGGTRILCRVIDEDGSVLAEAQWPTTTPEAALEAIVACITDALPDGIRLAGAGIAAFGPLIVDPGSAQRGLMLATTKPGWTGSNLRAALALRLGVPVAVDTDVNAAAIAEQRLGAGQGLPSVAYLTVGTGIGAGLATNGRALAGALHPEVGHIHLVRQPGDSFVSGCPYHADCAEGLAAGPAIGRRLGAGRTLADAPEVAALVADYLGQLIATLICAWSPHRVVLGGGVMNAPGLIPAIDVALRRSVGNYGVGAALEAADFLVAAALPHAGLEGALLMAREIGDAG